MRMYLFAIGGFLLISLTFANILASQIVYKPLMFRLVTLQNADAGREFLANLEGTELFSDQSQYLNSIFDNIFAIEVDTKFLNIEKNITKYENLLRLNQKNRDILITLAFLYKDQGTTQSRIQSQKYYTQAKEVDPWVHINALESL